VEMLLRRELCDRMCKVSVATGAVVQLWLFQGWWRRWRLGTTNDQWVFWRQFTPCHFFILLHFFCRLFCTATVFSHAVDFLVE